MDLHPGINKRRLLDLPFALQVSRFAQVPFFSHPFLTSQLCGVKLGHVGAKSWFHTGIPCNT